MFSSLPCLAGSLFMPFFFCTLVFAWHCPRFSITLRHSFSLSSGPTNRFTFALDFALVSSSWVDIISFHKPDGYSGILSFHMFLNYLATSYLLHRYVRPHSQSTYAFIPSLFTLSMFILYLFQSSEFASNCHLQCLSHQVLDLSFSVIHPPSFPSHSILSMYFVLRFHILLLMVIIFWRNLTASHFISSCFNTCLHPPSFRLR
ncbi:hypothetical protein CPB83DRAFT_310362 [Crepidotus variabilis]|uniref:Uncharacterized protein n=1 Tax=Crepidotus variabilis TaxID=179855 RepID=A0A9P6E080_9AGAR|nr:hypothetical protein CPB83DRAFT_310362 [Crepidotus variabilis]